MLPTLVRRPATVCSTRSLPLPLALAIPLSLSLSVMCVCVACFFCTGAQSMKCKNVLSTNLVYPAHSIPPPRYPYTLGHPLSSLSLSLSLAVSLSLWAAEVRVSTVNKTSRNYNCGAAKEDAGKLSQLCRSLYAPLDS